MFYNSDDKKELKLLDKNNNNYLDLMELNKQDAEAFRLWFESIIINIYNKNILIPESYSDCSGIIRYSYKESLKKHDQTWISNNNYKSKIFNDVEKYNYPDIPFIGEKLFLIDNNIKDLKSYSNFASARYLIEHNMKKIGKNINNAISGDILAFFHPYDIEYPYHLMVYIKQKNNDYVIYHTGPISIENPGELRLVLIDNLKYADPTWMIDEKNKNFLGIYRFKILGDYFE
ncbi:MAG: DUF1175 family protein [Thermotogota bacterium]